MTKTDDAAAQARRDFVAGGGPLYLLRFVHTPSPRADEAPK